MTDKELNEMIQQLLEEIFGKDYFKKSNVPKSDIQTEKIIDQLISDLIKNKNDFKSLTNSLFKSPSAKKASIYSRVNMIPSSEFGGCSEVLVTMVGQRGKHVTDDGFDNRIKRSLPVLLKCKEIKTWIIITQSWEEQMYESWKDIFSTLRNLNVRLIVLFNPAKTDKYILIPID